MNRMTHLVIPLIIVAGVLANSGARLTAAASPPNGKQIYLKRCARCHGNQGQGVKDHCSEPLRGEYSIPELTEIIEETMPEDDPEQCEGADAAQVAKYIHAAFYAPHTAGDQAAPRIELSRLTARQYDHAVSDLITTFIGTSALGSERGVTGQYFSARNFRNDKKAFERRDACISFDFGKASPQPDKMDAAEFAIRWQGAILAEETGRYDFYLKTDNGARLWINDNSEPLIDAWVKSGDDNEHRATVRLLGGQPYFLRLDFFKYKTSTAAVTLEWQPPHGSRQVIPKRNLAPGSYRPIFVLQTEFPPDDSSTGYERGTNVSEAWEQAVTYAALEVADYVVKHAESLGGGKPDADGRVKAMRSLAERFVERAFRRPLSKIEHQLYIDTPFASTANLELVIKKVILLTLTSPRFLYLGLARHQLDDYEVASHLSFGLWDSLPDKRLLQDAAAGQLSSPDRVVAHARRMLKHPWARAKMHDFSHQWLPFNRAEDLAKDTKLYPGFDQHLVTDLRTSIDLFVEDIVWSDDSDFRQLLLSNELFVNRTMAEFYGLPAPADDGSFHKIECDPQRHTGVLTHPFLMSALAYHRSSSPIHRGVFVVRGLIGRSLKPPPIAVAPADPGQNPNLTTRERFLRQTSAPACQTCHHLINPLGFGLEHYDAVGRFRETEADKPIDATGAYKTLTGEEIAFDGSRALAQFLADSEEVHRCFVEVLFHNLVKQPASAYGDDCLDQLTRSFRESDFDIQALMVEIMRRTALVPAQ